MKPHIMNEILMRIRKRRIHLGHLFSKLGNMLVRSPLRSQRSNIGLKHQARLKHLPRKKTMQCPKHRK